MIIETEFKLEDGEGNSVEPTLAAIRERVLSQGIVETVEDQPLSIYEEVDSLGEGYRPFYGTSSERMEEDFYMEGSLDRCLKEFIKRLTKRRKQI